MVRISPRAAWRRGLDSNRRVRALSGPVVPLGGVAKKDRLSRGPGVLLAERCRRSYLASQPPAKRLALAEPWRCECSVLAGCGAALDAKPVHDARATYRAEGCLGCHGRQRSGASMGPDLRRVRRYWNSAELLEYLAAPATCWE